MFSWGEDGLRGFRLKDGATVDGGPPADGRVQHLELGYRVADLCAGRGALAFVKTNGNAFVIRTSASKDGTRVRGKQKFVKCKEKIRAVGCYGDDGDDDDVVMLLSEGGNVLCVNTTHTSHLKPLAALCNKVVSQVACGSRHSVALTQGGQVYTWGRDSRGQLGLGRSGRRSDSPQHLRSLSALPLVQVAAGGDQSFALSVSGGVFGWGGNHRGQLGLGDTTDRHVPTPVDGSNTKTTIHISCGEDHTAILTKNGAVFTFGSGQHGQLGHNSFADELRPRLVVELWGAKVTKVAWDWWSALPPSTMLDHVKVWKQTLSGILSLEPVPRNSGVRNLMLVLQYMYNYIHAEPLILCSFPILMDLDSKLFVFNQNAAYSKVYFDENYTDVDDNDLYIKDFFHEVFHEMMSPETGMFMFNDSQRLAWFPKDTEEDQRYFHFGVLCGLALYNQHIIYLPFPLALFKKLLGVKPSLGDMMEFSPCVGQSLLNILENYEDDVIKNLEQDFVIIWDGAEVDLDPKSPEKPLTGENKKEFVDAYVNHAFNTSVKGVFQEFKRGFFQVCDQDLVKLFRPKELQKVLVGADLHDWAKLKQNTVYEGVYSATPPHPTIQMFWEVFDELSEDQKKAFLWFVTGFEGVPVLGMEQIKMKVKVPNLSFDQYYLSYDQYHPKTHTCDSTLELPLYSTKEIMQTKLTEALSKNRRSYKHHTLALTDSNRVYSFGCGEQGQLGRGEESHPSVPLAVRLPRDARNDLKIKNIYAGGNCSFATRTPIKEARKESNDAGIGDVTGDVIDRWVSECDSKSWKKIKREIRRTFSSASAVNQTFLDRSEDKHFQTSSKYSGLDLSAARHAFENLAKKDHVEAALLQMLPALDEMPVGVEGLRVFLLLNELLRAIQSTELAEAAAAAVQRLCADSLQALGDWWSSLPRSTMEEHVEVWKQAFCRSLSSQSTVPWGSGVRNLLLVLQMMYNANHRVVRRQRISEQAFGLEFSPMFLQAELQYWCRTSSIEQKHLNKMMFPFGLIPASFRFFELKLKRGSLLEGTFKQLAAAHPSDFKKQLVVYFDENPELKHVYEKDLFHHLFGEMMTTVSGMFMFNDSKTLAWFPSTTTEESKTNFFLLGVLCGLALYNRSLIHFPFPLALFKKLLGVEPTLDDLEEFSPVVGKRLQCILGYEEEDLEDLKDMDFEVCERTLVKLFLPEQLRGALVGQDVYDWPKLKENAVWGPHFDDNTKKMFWEIFDELTEDQRKDFFLFVTGYRIVPILGMDQIQMKVQVPQVENGQHHHDELFPESLTCHSILYLPLYSSKELLRRRLTAALIKERGFSM
ncbi:putative E3 ubiquitin-protein ligase HERC6 [Liparis tanakae]|uniref:Putative E3 ubiquitin-protein ligase HERC6 n=1 Tax=Liparis tanakae TaxID=230148 RepID=A0A4Z2GP11_9TELE|nr:putative E3 ubiquitin-protein ligase HERC6 [Liparis tanakae]